MKKKTYHVYRCEVCLGEILMPGNEAVCMVCDCGGEMTWEGVRHAS